MALRSGDYKVALKLSIGRFAFLLGLNLLDRDWPTLGLSFLFLLRLLSLLNSLTNLSKLRRDL